jgi:hypothetical protein
MHVKISVSSQQIKRRYLLVLFKAEEIIFNNTYLLSHDLEVAPPYLFNACLEV